MRRRRRTARQQHTIWHKCNFYSPLSAPFLPPARPSGSTQPARLVANSRVASHKQNCCHRQGTWDLWFTRPTPYHPAPMARKIASQNWLSHPPRPYRWLEFRVTVQLHPSWREQTCNSSRLGLQPPSPLPSLSSPGKGSPNLPNTHTHDLPCFPDSLEKN